MDLVQSSRKLIQDMIQLAGSQMKLLLMDAETTPTVSCAFAQSEVMQKEVYIFDRIENKTPSDNIKNLKCVVFVRPTTQNIERLVKELQEPRFSQYYLYFTNTINKYDVKKLAEADKNETVREVQEVFLDGIPLRKDLYTLNFNHIFDATFNITDHATERIKNGIIALLLQLRKAPAVRYQKSSSNCKKVGEEVAQFIRRENGLFENARKDTVLFVVERSIDVVTPLLNQWTYEAMIHEMLTLTNNRCTCGDQNVVLSELHDDFFANNITSNFGEIGQNIKTLISEFQEKKHINKNLESIQDMKKFVEDYPQFKKISGTVSKHVSLVGELSSLVQKHNLLEISEVEQTIVSDGEQSKCFNQIRGMAKNSKTRELDIIRLVLLYALRFQNVPGADLRALTSQLKNQCPKLDAIVEVVLKYGGVSRRPADLFGGQSTIDITKRFIKGLKGVENIYTQHSPYLKNIIEACQKGKLDNYPLMSNDCDRVDNIIVFVVGGATYEEAAFVRNLNDRRSQGYGGPAVILAGNTMLNTKAFLEEFASLNRSTGTI
ncbi:CBN-VPS-45 protein [Caenorhabditis brenneri]|uniref:CBN-VPS-45 protein n=1 Tax=Caenorhabditis brenneri TaxID=135651 RepID=G0N7N4_CAEBE|nr:CBN-VPS-45 protein [Caenorhabditis brenneri]